LHEPATGRFSAYKELTTPDEPARGVIAGIRALLEREKVDARADRPRRARDDAADQCADRA
jgi:N-methylhydantoinase A/oxoprolinase/acetone carboxylase beta subunit